VGFAANLSEADHSPLAADRAWWVINSRTGRPIREPNMTAFSIKTVRQIGFALVAAGAMALTSTASHAYSQEAAQMCTNDAFRLCSSEIPNIAKITTCMRSHRSELSSGCRTVMDRDAAAARSHKVAAE